VEGILEEELQGRQDRLEASRRDTALDRLLEIVGHLGLADPFRHDPGLPYELIHVTEILLLCPCGQARQLQVGDHLLAKGIAHDLTGMTTVPMCHSILLGVDGLTQPPATRRLSGQP
jgi:hypothetical protein